MERMGTPASKTRTRVFDEGNFRGYTEYLIESEPGARPAPQAFLVHQQPGWVLPPHFHLEEQFQVVTRGGGTLGRHEIAAITVHYSSREAGYGPLVAGPEGLDYLTLRAVTDPGAWYLPGAKDKLQAGARKRHATVGPVAVRSSDSLGLLSTPETEVLIAPDDEGLAAWVVRLPPGSCCPAPETIQCGGRFHVVVGGTVARGGLQLGPQTCVWRDGDDEPMLMEAELSEMSVLVIAEHDNTRIRGATSTESTTTQSAPRAARMRAEVVTVSGPLVAG